MKRQFIASLLAATLLTACATSKPPQSSGITPPSLWSRLTGSSAPADKTADLNAPLAQDAGAQVDQSWWKNFKDPTLDVLVAEALANNKTLAIAKARVEEARANRGIARAQQLPEIDGVADGSRGNQGFATNDKPVGLADADLEASWELDLFGPEPRPHGRSAGHSGIGGSRAAGCDGRAAGRGGAELFRPAQ